MQRPLKFTLIAVAAVLLPIGAYAAYVAWDIHRLETFCEDVLPGTPIQEIALIAKRHGIKPDSIIDARTFPEAARDQSMLVLSHATLGEMTCSIELGDAAVVSAEVYGP
jgi:hypothetical protein